MSMLDAKIDGLNELGRNLSALEPKVARKAFRKGMRAGAQVIANEAKATAPVLTGRLKRAIRVRSLRARGDETVAAQVTTRAKSANAPHAPLVEGGTKFARARPFLGPAAVRRQSDAVDAVARKVADAVEGGGS